MRVEAPSTRWSKPRTGSHGWTIRSSKVAHLQREVVVKLELHDESLRGSDRSSTVDGHDKCRKQYGCVEQRGHDAKQEIQECTVVLRPDHVVHWQSSGQHLECSSRLAHGGMADALSSVCSEDQCKVGCDDARGVGFSVKTNDGVNSLETIEREIKEFERYANIEIPEFLKIGMVVRHAKEGPMRTHLINRTGCQPFRTSRQKVTNAEQAQSAVMARRGDAMDVDAFVQRCFQRYQQE